MKLDDNYNLEGDKFNWILSYESEVKTNGKGKEYTSKDQWYYPSIKDALRKYCDESARKAKSIEELKEIIINLNTLIDNLKIN